MKNWYGTGGADNDVVLFFKNKACKKFKRHAF